MKITATIHLEDGSYWAEVAEYPGLFAAGDTLDELLESLRDGLDLMLEDDDAKPAALTLKEATLAYA